MMEQSRVKWISPETWATILIIISGILYGMLGFAGTQLIRDNFSVVNMLFWRFFIAAIWMIFFSIVRKEKLFQKLPRVQTLLIIFVFGSIFYSGSSLFYFLASLKTGTGLAMVLLFSFPIFIAFYSWFYKKKKISGYALVSLCSIILGLSLMRGQGAVTLSLTGIALALAAAISYALYVINGQHTIHQISASLSTILVCLGNSIIFFSLALSGNSFCFPHSLHAWLYALAIGIFATAVPIQLMLEGLKIINSLKASILSLLEPVITLLVGFVLLGESISSWQVMGVAVILLSAVVIQFEKSAPQQIEHPL